LSASTTLRPPQLFLPAGYISGHSLSDSATYDDATFASLQATPGTYTWTWGTGTHADSFTLQIGPVATTPEPASLTLLAMGLAGLGLALRTRRA
jgi:MYXO-CTERM domain-containing protein